MGNSHRGAVEEARGNEKVWKVVSLISGLLAAQAATAALNSAWRKLANAPEPPTDPESPETSWGEAAAWAMLTGAAIGLARFIAGRVAAATWVKKVGALPPAVGERGARQSA
jgi:Protein of unknown function (DUF4235)